MPIDDAGREALEDEAVRLGSRALFYNSLLSLAATFIMPIFIREANETHENSQSLLRRIFSGMKIHLCDLWTFSHLLFALCMVSTL